MSTFKSAIPSAIPAPLSTKHWPLGYTLASLKSGTAGQSVPNKK